MPTGIKRLRFLLLQVRNTDDPMRVQEVHCFARALGCGQEQIHVFDLLTGAPSSVDARQLSELHIRNVEK